MEIDGIPVIVVSLVREIDHLTVGYHRPADSEVVGLGDECLESYDSLLRQ
jgi:hypothetical protein